MRFKRISVHLLFSPRAMRGGFSRCVENIVTFFTKRVYPDNHFLVN